MLMQLDADFGSRAVLISIQDNALNLNYVKSWLNTRYLLSSTTILHSFSLINKVSSDTQITLSSKREQVTSYSIAFRNTFQFKI